MRILRFWWDLPLDTPFRSTYRMIDVTEVTDKGPMFNEIVAAVKKTGCSWELIERTDVTTGASVPSGKPKR